MAAKMSAKMSAKTNLRLARCRVCHREMTDPAHIAAGIGPTCAQKALRAGTVASARAQAAKMARIERNVNRLVYMLDNLDLLGLSAEDGLIAHWLRRWRAIQARVQAA